MSKAKIRVLLISGRVLGEHYYPLDNERIRRLLESTGRFEVKVTEEFNGCTARTLRGYDLVFVNYDGAATRLRTPEAYDLPYVRWEAETEQVLLEYVRQGGGMYAHHSTLTWADDMPEEFFACWGITRSRRRWEPFMRNGYPGGDNGFDFKFTEENEFTRELPDHIRVVREDLYSNYVLDPDAQVKLLATAYVSSEPWKKNWDKINPRMLKNFGAGDSPVEKPEDLTGLDGEQPMAWINRYGEGRVFACTIGNDYETWNRIPYIVFLLRGIEWAATGEITIDPPDLSGAGRFRPWPYYDNLPDNCKTYRDVSSLYL
ncbi:MAG: ThuA domain-containing protein [Lachnospiraceae bacterium]|nr:ThuA domain-containing protein [Lachnospiraceae bacterium]